MATIVSCEGGGEGRGSGGGEGGWAVTARALLPVNTISLQAPCLLPKAFTLPNRAHTPEHMPRPYPPPPTRNEPSRAQPHLSYKESHDPLHTPSTDHECGKEPDGPKHNHGDVHKGDHVHTAPYIRRQPRPQGRGYTGGGGMRRTKCGYSTPSLSGSSQQARGTNHTHCTHMKQRKHTYLGWSCRRRLGRGTAPCPPETRMRRPGQTGFAPPPQPRLVPGVARCAVHDHGREEDAECETGSFAAQSSTHSHTYTHPHTPTHTHAHPQTTPSHPHTSTHPHTPTHKPHTHPHTSQTPSPNAPMRPHPALPPNTAKPHGKKRRKPHPSGGGGGGCTNVQGALAACKGIPQLHQLAPAVHVNVRGTPTSFRAPRLYAGGRSGRSATLPSHLRPRKPMHTRNPCISHSEERPLACEGRGTHAGMGNTGTKPSTAPIRGMCDTWISGSDVNSFCCFGLVHLLWIPGSV
jgi:hypothetical protein